MKEGMLLVATSFAAISVSASNQARENSTFFVDISSHLESSVLKEYMSNDLMYYFPIPIDYRALYKKIAQSKWYVNTHRDKSLGEEMQIEY